MKHVFSKIMLLLFVSATCMRCSEEAQSPSSENVQVTFSFSAQSEAGGRIKAGNPDALVLSLSTTAGEPVFSYKKVKILAVGDAYITEAVDLAPGSYQITDFLLADEADTVLFATPQKGSALAKAVSHPLPYGFTVVNERVVNVTMEVVDVSASLPEDFGYASFFIETVTPIKLAVFTQANGKTELSAAKLEVYTNGTLTKTYSLGAKYRAM